MKRLNEVRIFTALFVMLAWSIASAGPCQAAANPNAMPEADAILDYFYDLSGSGTISGHQLEFYTTELQSAEDIHAETGKWLGLVGGAVL